jgi:hypothetical protein
LFFHLLPPQLLLKSSLKAEDIFIFIIPLCENKKPLPEENSSKGLARITPQVERVWNIPGCRHTCQQLLPNAEMRKSYVF